MALGYADAQGQSAEICRFFDWVDPSTDQGNPASGDPSRPERRLDPLRLR
jgi:hypothetical protein